MKFVILLILLIWDDEDSVETNIFGLNVKGSPKTITAQERG